jgi:uncharacterized protein YukE
VARTQGRLADEGNSGRVKFLPFAWAGTSKTSFRKNSDSSEQTCYRTKKILSHDSNAISIISSHFFNKTEREKFLLKES